MWLMKTSAAPHQSSPDLSAVITANPARSPADESFTFRPAVLLPIIIIMSSIDVHIRRILRRHKESANVGY
jgi:hypothetical protein